MLFLANLPWYASFSWYQLHLWSYEHNWLYGIFRECKVEIFFVIVSYEHIDIIFQMLFFKAKFTSLFLIESVTVNFFLLFFFFFCFFLWNWNLYVLLWFVIRWFMTIMHAWKSLIVSFSRLFPPTYFLVKIWS